MKTSKKELHIMIDLLPECEILAAKRFLEFLTEREHDNHDDNDCSGEQDTREDSFYNEREKVAAETGWKEYKNGKSKPLAQVIKEQLYVEEK